MLVFNDRFEELTPELMKEVCDTCKWYCEHEVTAVGGNNETTK